MISEYTALGWSIITFLFPIKPKFEKDFYKLYLTTSQIPYLVKYLEVLVQRDDCTGQHNALLLNCYIIQKDLKNLMNFIKNHKILTFEIDKVFNLLRKVRLFEEALALAERYDHHDWYLKILIEDQCKYKKAIDYISKLSLQQTEEALLNYGNTLINIDPETVANLLEFVCDKQSDSKLNITTILKVFVNNRKGLKHFLNRYISKIISIEENYSIYVDTLLELLLYEVQKEPEISKISAQEAMSILRSDKLLYHRSKALICCQMRGFSQGYQYLCELQENYLEILNSFKAENNLEGVMNTCHKFGSREPGLWIKALEYLIEVNADLKYFTDVITEIEGQSLISPLLLLEKMTASPHSLQFGLVKDFILRYYEKNEKLIDQYQSEISKLREETKKNNEIIQGLDNDVQVFQNLKCMICSSTLEIPSVHFLCNHSYHKQCFDRYTKSSDECPNCAPQIESIISEINQWQSDKLNALTESNKLSLEKLWRNVLSNSQHPISIDPDQFLSESLVNSIMSADNIEARSNLSTSETKPIKPTDRESKENPIGIRIISSTNDIKNYNVAKVSSVEKVRSQSPDILNNFSRKQSVPINPFEKTSEPVKSSIPMPKNPFESSSVKTGGNLSGSVKSNSSQNANPFGEFKDLTNNYPDNLNPFEM